MNRSLTLDDIPNNLLAEYGLQRGGATVPSYRCTNPQAILVPIAEITAPVRKLNECTLRCLLRGIHDGDDIPPIVIFREPGAPTAQLLDGLHRWRISLTLGFASIPATQPSRDDAELCYRYRRI